jgi:hypothetical protein
MMHVALLVVATFATAVLSAVAGFGGGALLLPVFVAALGARDAVAVLTITQLASNGSRAWLNRAEIHTRLVALYAAGAVPAAVAGALLLSHAPLRTLTVVMGAFLLTMVVWRRIRPDATRVGDAAFAGIGAASGFGSALIGSVGGLAAPFFLARGLVRGAYIGTESASTLVMHLTKLIVFSAAAVLTLRTGLIGLALTPASVAGAWAGKRILDRLPVRVFVLLVEAGLVTAGVLLILS